MIDLEIFSCAGGMSEGFRRAGIEFSMAVDMAADHCDSYERNLGHRPVRMDARDLLRMARLGWSVPVRLLVADPPCTPWSRAGKRKGTLDERDMLRETAEIISILKPRAYLIGNVPGLEDANNLPIVQDVIGGLARDGYCVRDFATLDAADYGVPQHRVRPFWFGHLHGPCIRWPEPSHGDPKEIQETLPGVTPLLPWMSCGQALGHLTPKELGRMVKLRKRGCHGKQHGSVPLRPARVVGTSNLSDGNVYLDPPARIAREGHPNSKLDRPALSIAASMPGNGGTTLELPDDGALAHPTKHPPSYIDEPAMAVRASSGGGAVSAMQLEPRQESRMRARDIGRPGQGLRTSSMDKPLATMTGKAARIGAGAGHVVELGDQVDRTLHEDRPARTMTAKDRGAPLILNDRHAPAEINAPAPTMGAKYRGQAAQVLSLEGRGSLPQSQRLVDSDRPADTLQAREDRLGSGMTMTWPWTRPATAIMGDPRLGAPGHKDKKWKGKDKKRGRSTTRAVLLSEKAAAILQGFPDDWVFSGVTKKIRWSQIGQAMPPPLAHAVARSVVEQLERTVDDGPPECFVPWCEPPRRLPTSATEQLALMTPPLAAAGGDA